MASVRMTKHLRSAIVAKFREALVATTQKNPKIVDLGDKLYEMVHSPLEMEWLQLTEKLMASYDGTAQKRKNAMGVNTASAIYVILCPNQAENIAKGNQEKAYENLYMLSEWESKANKYSGRTSKNPGEISVEIPLSGEKPMIIRQDHWYSTYDNVTTIRNGFCIADKELIELILAFTEGSVKVTDSIDQLDEFLSRCTTLKKFLDEWPGAESLVPNNYIQKMFEKAVKTSVPHSQIIKQNKLEENFKDEMNAAILTSKLTQ